MHVSTLFSDMYSACKNIYQAETDYFKTEKELAKRLADCLGMTLTEKTDMKTIRQQLEPIRKSVNVGTIRTDRDRNEERRTAFLRQYGEEFRKASEQLPEAVKDYQQNQGLDPNDQTLQNTLTIAKIGKNLPEKTVRDLLEQYKTNRDNFYIVRGALTKAEVNPKYINNIFPYDGDDMQTVYDLRLGEVEGEKTENVFIPLSKLEEALIADARAFGVVLEPFIPEDVKEKSKNDSMRFYMGLSADSRIETLRMI